MGANECLKRPILTFKLGAKKSEKTGDVMNLSGGAYERAAFVHSK